MIKAPHKRIKENGVEKEWGHVMITQGVAIILLPILKLYIETSYLLGMKVYIEMLFYFLGWTTGNVTL